MKKLGNKKKVRQEADQTNVWVKQALIEKRLQQDKMNIKRFTL
jgi:replication-associated recombination protein RarA